jgi:hypothetical protein
MPWGHFQFALRFLTSFSLSGSHVQMFMKNIVHLLVERQKTPLVIRRRCTAL